MSSLEDVDIYCPHCARRIDLDVGPTVRRLRLAISLQAERFGTEIICRNCRSGFVYSRLPLIDRESRRRAIGAASSAAVRLEPGCQNGSYGRR